MGLLVRYTEKSKLFLVRLILLGGGNSLLYSALLIFINNTLGDKEILFFEGYGWVAFFMILATSFLINKTFQNYIIRLTHDILLDLELSIISNLRSASFPSFEKLGSQKIYAAISDTRIVSQIPEILVHLVNSTVIVLCGLGYLFWISWVGGLSIMAIMLGLVLLYSYRNSKLEKQVNELRDLQNDYFLYLRDLIEGFKEVKMSLRRSTSIFNVFLKTNRIKGRDIGVDTSIKYMHNEMIGNYGWFLLLGTIIFGFPAILDMQAAQTTSFVVTILYMMTPLITLISILPHYTKVKVAFERIKDLETVLSTQVETETIDDNGKIKAEVFKSLKMVNVVYEYYDEQKQDSFTLGPINLEIRSGELIFITGGNGSGKSTFINLLTGLYKPSSGNIYLNGHKIAHDYYPVYRDRISAIFTSAYLFDANYDGFALDGTNPDLNTYIKKMKMSHILSVYEGQKFFDNKMSKGQQKRLAMIYSMLEEKEVLVLDEWAAEQDPEFRAYFYNTLLSDFNALGKTIILVTHDDAYFNCAQRILKFDFGKIIADIDVDSGILQEDLLTNRVETI